MRTSRLVWPAGSVEISHLLDELHRDLIGLTLLSQRSPLEEGVGSDRPLDRLSPTAPEKFMG